MPRIAPASGTTASHGQPPPCDETVVEVFSSDDAFGSAQSGAPLDRQMSGRNAARDGVPDPKAYTDFTTFVKVQSDSRAKNVKDSEGCKVRRRHTCVR